MSNSTDADDGDGVDQKSSLAYTFSLNIIFFTLLILFFEVNRNLSQLFLKRLRKSFEMDNRVPGRPPRYLLGWIRHIMGVSNAEFLRMIGLDGYMLLRFISVCFKFCCFGSFFGMVVLVPVYGNGDQGFGGWKKYTLSNVVSSGDVTTDALWLPAVFSYIYLAYMCYLLHSEFEHFVLKRLEFLIQGDPDTFHQTHYTIMIENVPPSLRSTTELTMFFDKLFPGEVFSAEVMLQLSTLEDLCAERSSTRAKLEKAIALNRANGFRPTITVSIRKFTALKKAAMEEASKEVSSPQSTSSASSCSNFDFELDDKIAPRFPACDLDSGPHCCRGYCTVDAINYYTHLLYQQNIIVRKEQEEYLSRIEKTERELNRDHTSRAEALLDYTTENIYRAQSELTNKVTSPFLKTSKGLWDKITGTVELEQESDTSKEVIDNSSTRLLCPNFSCVKNIDDETLGGGLESGDELSHSSSLQRELNWNTEERTSSKGSCSETQSPIHTRSERESNSSQRMHSSASSSEDDSFQKAFHIDALAEGQEKWRGKGKRKSKTSEELVSPLNRPPEERKQSDSAVVNRVGGGIKKVVGDVASGLGASINEFHTQGVKTAKVAGKGAIRSVLEATRTLELLTLGAYYTTSSTAFVTFKTRSARSISCQMLLSHEHYRMNVQRAPNTADIIWDNVSIPEDQINARTSISGYSFGIMAIFWSAVVTFVVNFTDLDKLSEKYDWVANLNLRNFAFYDFINEYLAVVVLLLIITCLPFLFDFISRYYEGLKRESDIQQSIMARFFYYQLVNVYVTVASGTIVNSIQEILDRPRSLLSILGAQLPQVSVFFANLLLVKTLVSVPLELLRIWPLLQVYAVKYCCNKKKLTRRELREGAFADLTMDYGWVYPNLLFVLTITAAYSCISPFLMPISMAYFGSVYLMYKYQLLYVYVNRYQAGGHMWYAVFDRCMILLICGSLILLSYLGISKTFQTGPFYLLLPQPFLILYFWRYCNKKYIRPSAALSLECTKAIDAINAKLMNLNQETPLEYFDSKVYRQPSLVEPYLFPEAYRSKSMGGFRGEDDLVLQSSSSPTSDSFTKANLSKLTENEDMKAGNAVDVGEPAVLQRHTSSGSYQRDIESEYTYGGRKSMGQSFRLQSLQEEDDNMMESDIDLLLNPSSQESLSVAGINNEGKSDSTQETIERRTAHNSYGTTDKNQSNPCNSNESV